MERVGELPVHPAPRPHERPFPPTHSSFGVESDVGRATQEALCSGRGVRTGEAGGYATADPVSKRKGAALWPSDLEAFGVAEPSGVAIGCGEAEVHARPGLQAVPGHRQGLQCDARHECHG
jgi:hypothetical protein